MADEFTVAPDALVSAKHMIDAVAEDLHDSLAELVRDVDDILLGRWQGTAATGFEDCWSQWRAGADQVAAALSDSAELLMRTAVLYEVQEATNRDAFTPPAGGILDV